LGFCCPSSLPLKLSPSNVFVPIGHSMQPELARRGFQEPPAPTPQRVHRSMKKWKLPRKNCPRKARRKSRIRSALRPVATIERRKPPRGGTASGYAERSMRNASFSIEGEGFRPTTPSSVCFPEKSRSVPSGVVRRLRRKIRSPELSRAYLDTRLDSPARRRWENGRFLALICT
jgi:hypothetical protein